MFTMQGDYAMINNRAKRAVLHTTKVTIIYI